jgi:uncharacterized protein with NAD-binding domain and iron-sulfur cluster
MGPRDVAILGGGMAGLVAAWRLSQPRHRDRVGRVTVYQRGWRLGGKGASSRGVNGRIEEHGLHVWLGYYDNAFRVMRDCYAELDRARTDPSCPIRDWTDAFRPAPHVGLASGNDSPWVALFSDNDDLPGDPDVRDTPLSFQELLLRGLRLIGDFARSVSRAPEPGRIVLSAHQTPPPRPASEWSIAVREVTNFAVAAALELSTFGVAQLTAAAATSTLTALADAARPLEVARDRLRSLVCDDPARRRWFELVDLVVTCLRGVTADGLLYDPRGLRAIDGEEFCDWLRRHDAAPETLESPLVTGVYDLAFAAQDGDPGRRRFGAGTGLYMSSLMYFGYRGSLFWKMQAGMGDIVFAPLYQALVERGVRFEFFSRVEQVVPGVDGSIASVRLHSTQPHGTGSDYEPLVRVQGIPCFPAAPIGSDADSDTASSDESHWGARTGTDIELVHGRDFDDVVVAMSLGILPHTCARLIEQDDRWAGMVRHVGTVSTQAFQLWLRPTDAQLGIQPGVTVTGGRKPFDTFSSMSHLVDVEEWPVDAAPGSIVYFCSTFDGDPPTDGPDPTAEMDERVRESAMTFLDEHGAAVLPGAATAGTFRWDLLCGEGDEVGPARFGEQFWTANVDPSDRYVQSLPGSGDARIRPDESGWSNLFLAGDWTDCGLNVGCIEAAAVSGLQAANAVLERERWDEISGYWEPLERR